MEHPDPFIRGLAEAVAEALSEAGLTLSEASIQSGIPKTTLHRRLNAVSPFLVTELRSLATLAGTTDTALMERAQSRGAA